MIPTTCCDCGVALDQHPVGRPRKRCDACRAEWGRGHARRYFHEVIKPDPERYRRFRAQVCAAKRRQRARARAAA